MAGGGIRTLCTTLAHRPLQGDTAQKYLFNIGLAADGVIQKLTEGVHAHLVDDAPSTALPYIGADRLVLRGLTESDASYRARLRRAIDDYQWAGNARAVLGQVLGYVLADTPAARTVSSSYSSIGVNTETQWNLYAAGADTSAAPTHVYEPTGEWDWDSDSPTNGSWGWWRWYLVIESVAPNDWIARDDLWGSGGTWGDGKAWGVDATSAVGRSFKIIVGQWKASVCHWIMVSFDAAELRPGAAVIPDGKYGRWSKLVGGVYVRARSSNALYFEGQ
jgi:hypothetical protein